MAIAQASQRPPARTVARAAWPSSSRPAIVAPSHGAGRDVAVIRRISHRWNDLFDLVLDLERYPAFVPHCRAVKVFSRKVDARGRCIIVSRMTVGLSAWEVGYANRTIGDRTARRIEVAALDGPLSHLQVVWTFTPDGDGGTRVEFFADYGFSNPVFGALASRVFDATFSNIVGAFERHADRLFGRKPPHCSALREART